MFIIGISGEPGAGKTTISNSILSNQNIRVIHLDRVFDSIKKVATKNDVLIKNNGEVALSLNNDSLVKRLLHSRYAGKFFYSLADLYGTLWLCEKVKLAELDNIDFLIIEGCSLSAYLNIDSFDFSVFINTSYEIRNERIIKREGYLRTFDSFKSLDSNGYLLTINNDCNNVNDLVDYLNEEILDRYYGQVSLHTSPICSIPYFRRKHYHL